ncbi:MAG: lysophospholipid acyltransferase family protein [Bacteroides sp.]
MSKLVYYLAYIGFVLIAILPFRLLYILSDCLYFLMYYIIRYRRKVVYANLKHSFPAKKEAELKQIEHKFYHYICDYMLESEKMLLLSEKELYKRMKLNNTAFYLDMIEKHGGVVVMMPHYGNFEWTIEMGMYMKPKGYLPVQIYKPIKNKYIDKLVLNIRSRFGGCNVPKHSTVRQAIKLKREGIKYALGLISDQCPNEHEINYWTTFLNQETDFMDGGERIAKMMDFPVLYCSIKKEKRGYGEATFELITEKPKETEAGEITEMFARRVEQTILQEPAYWWWSHKRWKHKKSDKD